MNEIQIEKVIKEMDNLVFNIGNFNECLDYAETHGEYRDMGDVYRDAIHIRDMLYTELEAIVRDSSKEIDTK